MNDSYTEFLAKDRRLRILELLHESGGSMNHRVMTTALGALGHSRVAEKTLKDDFRLLEKRDLIVSDFIGDMQVVTITRRGVEVAKGIVQVDDVQPPEIGV